MSTKIISELGLGLRVYFASIQISVAKHSWRAFISSTLAQGLNPSGGISRKNEKKKRVGISKNPKPFLKCPKP
jgi:hypothetical protein